MATGGLAYCLYLFHTFFGMYANALLSPHLPPTATAKGIIIVLTLVVTFVFAKLSWKYFEKPLIDRGREFRTFQPTVKYTQPSLETEAGANRTPW